MSPSPKQSLGNRGEAVVAKYVRCPGCKKPDRTFRLLPNNFKCADVVCDFCGYLAQVKTKLVEGEIPETCPSKFPGAAWGPQQERMAAGIYFSLYLVVEGGDGKMGVWFLPRDLQTPEMFVARKPLGPGAKREGWQGFMIDTAKATAPPIRYADGDIVEFRFNV